MTAADVVIHNSPDRWDAAVLIAIGIAIAAAWTVAKDQVREAASAFWGWVNTIADQDVATKKKTTSWANRWGGDSKSVAEHMARLDAGEYHVRSWPPVTKNPTRLADFRAAQTKQRKSA